MLIGRYLVNVELTPHRRFNPLSGQWVLVSPHRNQRPWQGKQEPPARHNLPAHDRECYLCPGNTRAGGMKNENYTSTFVFTNDFPAVLPDGQATDAVGEAADEELFSRQNVRGTCRVVCFSPRHDLTLAEMPAAEIRKVVDLWAEQVRELEQTYRWVQVFENKGSVMGCSNPHPHGQIWATDVLPNEPEREDGRQLDYYRRRGRPLLADYAAGEAERRERVVVENTHWLAVVPYWATWPFETLLLPRRQVRKLTELTDEERDSLAGALKELLTRYDNLFETSFPYSMGWHGAPADREGDGFHWQLHAHFYPPLLRSATVKKFMVGYEMLGEAQRDLTPEQAAQRLRKVSTTHYRIST